MYYLLGKLHPRNDVIASILDVDIISFVSRIFVKQMKSRIPYKQKPNKGISHIKSRRYPSLPAP